MKLVPVMTERSMADAKEGRYTFWVGVGMRKGQIKEVIGKAFGVHVKEVRTINYKQSERLSVWRKKITTKAKKKAIVRLAEGEKIEIFGESGKKKKK